MKPHPLQLNSCKQHKSTFLFHSSSHIFKPFPFNVPIFKVPSLIFTLFLYSMLPAMWWWGFCWSSTKFKILLSFRVGRMPFLKPNIQCLNSHIKTLHIYNFFVTLTYISCIIIIECLNWYSVHHSVGMTIVIQWWIKMIQAAVQSFTTSYYVHKYVNWKYMLHVYSPWLVKDWIKIRLRIRKNI